MASAEARLSLDGSSLPIVARIESSEGDVLVVGRRLPFLELGTRMKDASGREGAISQVSLKVEDGVPYLRVELTYAPLLAPRRERRDATLGYEARPSTPPSRPSMPPAALDATNHDSTLSAGALPASVRDLPYPGEAPASVRDARGEHSGRVDPLAATQALVRPSFVPSLVPMPLPIPEATSPAPRRFRYRAGAFLAAFLAIFAAWWRPTLPF